MEEGAGGEETEESAYGANRVAEEAPPAEREDNSDESRGQAGEESRDRHGEGVESHGGDDSAIDDVAIGGERIERVDNCRNAKHHSESHDNQEDKSDAAARGAVGVAPDRSLATTWSVKARDEVLKSAEGANRRAVDAAKDDGDDEPGDDRSDSG